MLEPFIIRTYT